MVNRNIRLIKSKVQCRVQSMFSSWPWHSVAYRLIFNYFLNISNNQRLINRLAIDYALIGYWLLIDFIDKLRMANGLWVFTHQRLHITWDCLNVHSPQSCNSTIFVQLLRRAEHQTSWQFTEGTSRLEHRQAFQDIYMSSHVSKFHAMLFSN